VLLPTAIYVNAYTALVCLCDVSAVNLLLLSFVTCHISSRCRYLFIKEVAEATNPDDVIIVTSSLTKDMNCSEDLYRYITVYVYITVLHIASGIAVVPNHVQQIRMSFQ
jgi:hypothetical protein